LHYLFGIDNSVAIQILLIAGITGMATISVVLGLDGGIRRLSELNIRLAALMLVAMMIVGPTLFIMDSFVQNLGYYIQRLPELSFWTEAYQQTTWQNDWTVFYWAWWIAWSPFVGMFIARISKGRTVREFVLGVLLVPSILTFLWISTFGGSAIFLELSGSTGIATAVTEDVSTSLFVLLSHFPYSFLSSLLGVVLIISFFVTSSDSGSLVIDSITAGGKLDAPVWQRVFWALTEGAVAGVLLIGGGLQALQTASITTGLPFAVVLLLMCINLFKAMRQEVRQTNPKT
jgi:choline/glycine/proline betaine transport protein